MKASFKGRRLTCGTLSHNYAALGGHLLTSFSFRKVRIFFYALVIYTFQCRSLHFSSLLLRKQSIGHILYQTESVLGTCGGSVFVVDLNSVIEEAVNSDGKDSTSEDKKAVVSSSLQKRFLVM